MEIGKEFIPYNIFGDKFPKGIRRNEELTPSAKWVWKILEEFTDENGICFTSQAKIAEELGLHELTISKALILLEKKGFIKKHPPKNRSKHDTHSYTFLYHECFDVQDLDELIDENRQEISSIRSQISDISKRRIPGWIYFLQDDSDRTKIGKTKNLTNRIFNIGILLPKQPILYHSFQSKDIDSEERELHQKYAQYRLNGEWFDLPKEELEHIKENY